MSKSVIITPEILNALNEEHKAIFNVFDSMKVTLDFFVETVGEIKAHELGILPNPINKSKAEAKDTEPTKGKESNMNADLTNSVDERIAHYNSRKYTKAKLAEMLVQAEAKVKRVIEYAQAGTESETKAKQPANFKELAEWLDLAQVLSDKQKAWLKKPIAKGSLPRAKFVSVRTYPDCLRVRVGWYNNPKSQELMLKILAKACEIKNIKYEILDKATIEISW